jgi:triosephosphate isomerase
MNTLIIANFKNFFSYHDEKNYIYQLSKLSLPASNQLIVCPSVINTGFYAESSSGLWYAGAQYCSPSEERQQTGGLSAIKLAACGVRYVILGHYETRRLFNWTYTELSASIQVARANSITPIICINDKGCADRSYFEQELRWLQTIISPDAIIAYEPIENINSSNAAPYSTINTQIAAIKSTGIKNKIVYGGSVNAENAAELKKQDIDGFIVGRSSTIFHELQKIVSL